MEKIPMDKIVGGESPKWKYDWRLIEEGPEAGAIEIFYGGTILKYRFDVEGNVEYLDRDDRGQRHPQSIPPAVYRTIREEAKNILWHIKWKSQLPKAASEPAPTEKKPQQFDFKF